MNILFFFILFYSFASAQEQVPLIEPSTAQSYIELDQNFNTWRRIKTALKNIENPDLNELTANGLSDVLMSKEDKTPKDIVLIELFRAPNELSISEPITEDMRRLIGPNGRRVIPVFEEELKPFENLGVVVGRTKAYKLLGRSSWYLAETPDGLGGLFFKLVQDIPLYREKADRAIAMADYLSEGMNEESRSFRDLFVPEFLRTRVRTSIGSKNKIFIFRSAEAILNPTGSNQVYPVHGLLGTDINGQNNPLRELLRGTGTSVREWKEQQFIPKLAELTAYLHLELGISLENHTQNLLVEVDTETGELKKILMRDLGDGLLNPIVRSLRNPGSFRALLASKIKFFNVAYHSWIEPGKSELTRIGYNTSVYTGQSLDSHGKAFKDRIGWNALFLREYLKSVQERVGSNIELSAKSLEIIESLESSRSTSEITEVPDPLKGKIDSAVAFVVEEIYQSGLDSILSNGLISRINTEIDQKAATKVFGDAVAKGRAFYSNSTARDFLVPSLQRTWLGEKISGFLPSVLTRPRRNRKLTYGEHQGRVYALDAETGKILGGMLSNSALNVPNSNRLLINRDQRSGSISCSKLLN